VPSPLKAERLAELAIAAGDYWLVASPARGGSILSFTWRGEAVMRETTGTGILDVACFPLVPFSNRIAGGRFRWLGREVALPLNQPDVEPAHPIHGYGWLAEWAVIDVAEDRLVLSHARTGDAWPWPYRADLTYALDAGGLTARLALTNCGDEAMPAGLGFHPYFPRTAQTRYIGLHRTRWLGEGNPLPASREQRAEAADWWEGQPVATRPQDTIYAGREGPLRIVWPERSMTVVIEPSPNLPLTAVYVPGDADWFCAEPVNHLTDAVNGRDPDGPMPSLAPGATLIAEVRISASLL